MSGNFSFTSESVSEGHPDKVADQISDAVLDAILAADPRGRVACETLVKTGVVIVAGEVTTSAWVDVEAIVRKTVLDIGYDTSDMGFDGAQIGKINVTEMSTYVAVERAIADKALAKLNSGLVKGKRVRARRIEGITE